MPEIIHMTLRFPKELYDKLKAEAGRTHRSFASLVISILYAYFDNPKS